MKFYIRISGLVFLFLGLSFSLYAQQKKLILKLKADYQTEIKNKNSSLHAFLTSLNVGLPVRRFPHHRPPDGRARFLGKPLVDLSLIFEWKLPEQLATDFTLQQIKKYQAIDYAEWEMEDAMPLFNPTDPQADSISGNQRQILRRILAYQGWNLSQGDTNVVIGLLDTGTPVAHEDMQSQLKINALDPPNGIDDDGNGFIDDFQGWDFGNEDSDPTPDNTGLAPGHGTSVSSLASAATDNGKGVAGIGFRCKILPLKIWKWAGNFSNFKGYDAIVYAADRGCKVINCSWGSARPGNQFEQDIINYATYNKGSVVVAAGGNTTGFLHFVPACYENVVGVAMTDSLDRLVANTSQHFKLDLSAPGVGIYGIKTDNNYGWVDGGSSMAAPLVSGAIALVRAKFPSLNGLQAAELVRVNADSIYHISGNSGFRDRAGRGRLNIWKALLRTQSISLRPVEIEIRNRFGLQARAGDTIFIYPKFENYLDSVSGFTANISSNSNKIQFLEPSRNYGPIGTLQSRREFQPFVAVVGNNVTAEEAISFRIQVRVGDQYEDRRWFLNYLNGRFLDLDSNEVQLTITANGRMGYMDNSNYTGSGIRFQGKNYCGEAGLMIGTSATKVSNSVYNAATKDDHFRVEKNIDFQQFTGINQHTVYHANDSAANLKTIGISFKQSTYELTADSLRGSVFFNYQLKNNNPTPLDSLCLGHYNDWDLENYNQNFARWDSTWQMGISQSISPKNKWVGVQILTGGEPQFYAIDAINSSANGNINLFDGFSLSEKWQTLSSGVAKKSAGIGPTGNNVVTVSGVKFRNFLPGQIKKVAIAYVFADSLTQLLARAKANQQFFKQLHTSPSPLAKSRVFCEGDSVLEDFSMPPGINQFMVSNHPDLNPLIYSGSQYAATIKTDSVFYVAGADSLYPGVPALWQYQTITSPPATFSSNPNIVNDSIAIDSLITFSVTDTSSIWANLWAINGQTQPDTTQSIVRSFAQPGIVTVCLQQRHRFSDCQGVSCKNIKVFQPLSNRKSSVRSDFQILPLPQNGKILIRSGSPVLNIAIRDAIGREIHISTAPNYENGGWSIAPLVLPCGVYYFSAQIGLEKIHGRFHWMPN